MIIQAFERPFRHWIIDDLKGVKPIYSCTIPQRGWTGWVHYNNDCEFNKRTTNKITELHQDLRDTFSFLFSPDWISGLKEFTGIEELQPDLTQWGAGLHATKFGGWLNCHLDYALHSSGLERRINAIAFLNTRWEEQWKGRFQLWDDSAREVVKSIDPKPGRVLVWESSDIAYHGTELVCGIDDRITAAVYYLAPARLGCTRKRALFVPKRQPS